ncbi:gamma-glutamyltransferase [Candidatus Sumerlaeota bacterium]|nr:gamma-glutamyltransferase [Candidatus Sumerlaeota bacterium]
MNGARSRSSLVSLLVLVLPAFANAQTHSPDHPMSQGMVVSAQKDAAAVGAAVLRDGGNAMDAAVATSLSLGVAEPFGSGLGGGGLLLYYEAKTGRVYFLDHRERCPAGVTPDLVREKSGDAFRTGGLAVAVPGTGRGLIEAHKRFGSMPLSDLAPRAAKLAVDGFAASEMLVSSIKARQKSFAERPAFAEIFLDEAHEPRKVGDVIRQPRLGETILAFGKLSDAAIYRPPYNQLIAGAVQAAGGVMTTEDIAAYKPTWREPIQGSHRGFEIVTAGPPSGGGPQVLHSLSILEGFPLGDLDATEPGSYLLTIGAMAYAQQRSDKLLADPNAMDPAAGVLPSKEEVAAQQEELKAALGRLASGALPQVPPQDDSTGNTTHFSIVDRAGNMVAWTQTINSFFGAEVMVAEMGIILNNEMADFDFEEGSVNFPRPGNAPRSSMSPMLLFADGKPVATMGTPGGRRIPNTMTQILVNRIDRGLTLQESIDASRVGAETRTRHLSHETGIARESLEKAANALGFGWKLQPQRERDRFFGGAEGIWIQDDEKAGVRNPVAGSDPRRPGAGIGENDVR